MTRLPLEGIRVIELSQAWAGPLAGMMLADLGAEVIKIESHRRPDIARYIDRDDETDTEHAEERAGFFHMTGRNKLSFALDLTEEEGRQLFAKLVAASDVVLENYTRRVLPQLGFDYERLRSINPQIIYAAMRGLASYGPYQDYVAFGEALEAFSGLDSLSGYPDRWPRRSGVPYPDPLSTYHTVAAILAALRYRGRSGHGQMVEVCERDATARVIGEAFLEWSARRTTPPVLGNRSPHYPRGCYRCAGEDRWLALSIHSDRDWQALCRVMGRPELASDPRFASNAARLRHHDELDAVIAAWSATKEHRQAMAELQGAGLAAGAVLTAPQLLEDPHLQARRFFAHYGSIYTGPRPHAGFVPKFSRTPLRLRTPPPTWGEHDEYVLRELLQLPVEQIGSLRERGIVGKRPELAPIAPLGASSPAAP